MSVASKYSSYSNEDLIELLQQKYKEKNFPPKSSELGGKYDMPSLKYYKQRFNTNSWHEILQLCNIAIPITKNITLDQGLEILKKQFQILQRIPREKDFIYNKISPSHSWYTRNFGSYNNALLEAGLIERIYSKEDLINISINEFKKISDKINKCPTKEEYDNLKQNGLSMCCILRHLKISYEEFCKTYIPKFNLNIRFNITENELKDEIIELKNKLGRPPMYSELKKYGIYHSWNMYRTRFGSYNKLIEKLGWIPASTYYNSESDEVLLDKFYNLFQQLNRIPTSKEIHNLSSAYYKRFGNIENICAMIGIDCGGLTNISGTYGTIAYDKNNGINKSIAEKNITNFFIDNNIYYEKQPHYSELLRSEGDLRRFDWKIKINNNEYYIEYFGMYNSNTKNKTNINYRYTQKAKKKIKDIYKTNKIKKCIFIFPKDLKNKNIENIFKNLICKNIISDSLYDVSFNNSISDEYILSELMKYSKNENKLPAYKTIRENKLWTLYGEIKKRYDTYEDFGIAMNKITPKRKKSDWEKEDTFNIFSTLIHQYGRILSPLEIHNNDNIKSIRGYEHNVKISGGLIKLRLEYYKYCLEHNIIIPECEIKILHKITNRVFPYGSNNVSDEIVALGRHVENILNIKDIFNNKECEAI